MPEGPMIFLKSLNILWSFQLIRVKDVSDERMLLWNCIVKIGRNFFAREIRTANCKFQIANTTFCGLPINRILSLKFMLGQHVKFGQPSKKLLPQSPP